MEIGSNGRAQKEAKAGGLTVMLQTVKADTSPVEDKKEKKERNILLVVQHQPRVAPRVKERDGERKQHLGK